MYRKIRFIFHLIAAFISKYRRLFIFGIIFGILFYITFPHLYSLLPPLRNTQTIALVGGFNLTNLPMSIQKKISIGLTSVASSGLPGQGLSDSWYATDSGKTYIFSIFNNEFWHDGSPVISRDIIYNFKDTTIEHPDDSHVIIRLPDAFSPLPVSVSRPIFKSVPKRSLFKKSSPLLGMGSYKLVSLHNNGQIIDSLILDPVQRDNRLPKLHYYFYLNPQAAQTAFKLGIVDTIESITDLGDLKTWPNVEITETVQNDRFVAVLFNTQSPIFSGNSGKNLRLALSYSIDKTRWTNRAYGPISRESWAFNPEIKTYDQDLERAGTLLKKVEIIPDALTIIALPTYLETAENIKTDWEKLGIKTNIQIYQEIPTEFDILLIAQIIPADPDQYLLWHSTQDQINLTHLKNPRIDKLLEDGRKIIDLEERRKIYYDFQKYLVEEVPAIFLYYPNTYTVNRKS
jgi:peptide/nickel transport system substrate-binding protein